jgi:hypothetical protein
MRVLFFTLLLFGCGLLPKPHKSKDSKDNLDALREKYATYLELVAQNADSYGFVGDHCDSLLFTSLAAHAGLPVNVFQAEKSPGEWIRHPANDCYPGTGSDSSISKDMFAGLLVYLSGRGDKASAKRITSYGNAHSWVMGSAKDNTTLLSKCLLSPGLISDFSHLAGLNLTEEHSSDDSIGVQSGYLGHLDVLHLISSASLYSGLSGPQLSLAKAYCAHSPRNSLYCGVSARFNDGDFSAALPTLLDSSLFPEDRLPSSADRCTDYLWQREDTAADWNACPNEGKTHSGVDFLIAAKVILGG